MTHWTKGMVLAASSVLFGLAAVAETAQEHPVRLESLAIATTLGARVEVPGEPGRISLAERLEELRGDQRARAIVRRLLVMVAAAERQGHRGPLASLA